MPFGLRTTATTASETPEILDVLAVYGVGVMYRLLGRLSTARDMIDVNIACGEAQQELDEILGQVMGKSGNGDLKPI